MNNEQDIRRKMNNLRKDYADGFISGDDYDKKMNKLSQELSACDKPMKFGVVKE